MSRRRRAPEAHPAAASMAPSFTPDRGKCRSCGASVYWVLTEAGRRMPVDVEPTGRALVLIRGGREARVVRTWQSHFASCPNADEHRKGAPDD